MPRRSLLHITRNKPLLIRLLLAAIVLASASLFFFTRNTTVPGENESVLTELSLGGLPLQDVGTILAQRYGTKTPSLWGEHLPGILSRLDKTHGLPGSPSVIALTLDACGGKQGQSYDKSIIDFLRKNGISATIFVTNQWIAANKSAFQDIAEDPLFEVAAHGSAHKPASVNGNSAYGILGTASVEELVVEVEGNVREIQHITGKRPRWFRSGTAYYDDVAVSIIAELGLGIAGFSIAADEGATLSAAEVEQNILTAQNGDILLCHLNQPASGTGQGIIAAIAQLRQRGCTFVTLSGYASHSDR